MGVTTCTVNSGERLRVKGLEGVDHPELKRNGASNYYHSVYDRHFVVEGTAKLTLMNLKLSGAWVGYTDTCGYCRHYVSCCTYGLELHFNVFRVAHSSLILSLILLHSRYCCLFFAGGGVGCLLRCSSGGGPVLSLLVLHNIIWTSSG